MERMNEKARKKLKEEEKTDSVENIASEEVSSELREPRWSVVSFEKCEAKNLTYAEAEAKLKELNSRKVSGLCIVTDEAASRV